MRFSAWMWPWSQGSQGVTLTMCLDTALLGCGPKMLSYLFGATADLQHAVNIFPGLVVVAYEPEEEAGVVQGSVAGRLADFLQAALQLLNCFSVYIQKRKRLSGDQEVLICTSDDCPTGVCTRGLSLLSGRHPSLPHIHRCAEQTN